MLRTLALLLTIAASSDVSDRLSAQLTASINNDKEVRIADARLSLHDEMRRMMEDEDDEDAKLLQVPGDGSMDAYLEESRNGLSNALGPRWNSDKLEDDAKKGKEALLKGISGGGALRGIMAAMR